MKTFFRKIFFWDAPAKGAFLALTLLVVLPRLLLTLGYGIALPLFLQNEELQSIVLYSFAGLSGVVVAILLYALVLFIHLVPRKRPLKLLLIGLGVTALLMAAAYGAASEEVEHLWWTLPAAFSASYIVYLFYPTVKIRDWLMAVLPLFLGSGTLYYQSAMNAKAMLWTLSADILLKEANHSELVMWLLALCGIASLAAAYLLFGRLLAKADRISFRSLFSKGIAVLWGLFVIAYLTSVGMVVAARQDYHKAQQELDAFWGIPVNFQSINDLYQKSGHIDQSFWDKLTSLKVEFPALNEQYDGFDSIVGYPNAVLPPEIHEQWKRAFTESPELAEFEKCLTAPLPLPERSNVFEFGNSNMNVRSHCRAMTRLEAWRIRLALEGKDIHAAQRALQRMDNITDVLQQDYTLVAGLVRCAVESMRAQAFARILESGLADDQWLEEQQTLLLAKEGNVPAMEKRMIMGEAANTLKAIDFCFDQVSSSLFLTFPEAWLLLGREGAVLARCYCISDFSDFPEKPAGLFAQMLAPALHKVDARKFPELVATLRISRGMIAAELARRQNGRFPDALDNLPMDPFSGKPLNYAIGKADISEMHFVGNDNTTPLAISAELQQQLRISDEQAREFSRPRKYDFKTEWRTVDAVKIWSIGENRMDEGGTKRHDENTPYTEHPDDICLIRSMEHEQKAK